MIGNENLKQLYNLLSPDYIVLQFGLNIVRNIKRIQLLSTRIIPSDITVEGNFSGFAICSDWR